MNKERYLKTMEWLKSHEEFTKTLISVEKLFEIIIYAVYPAFLLHLVFADKERFLTSVLTCFIPFVLVSIFREKYNAKRPYEVYETAAAIPKDKKGRSMPSRHVFSATIISVSIFFSLPVLGVSCFLIALAIAFLRVFLGVHFIKDVVVGALVGLVFGILGSLIF